VGQINMNGGPVTFTLNGNNPLNAVLFNPLTQPATAYSSNQYVATWPSISIRGTRGKPVVVNWVNEFPNNHLFCPHPEAADWPCSIDRTFMGVKAAVEPSATAGLTAVPWDRLNQYGSPQQPDNSWVTHLHGGEIPPQTDGFAEKWYGNRVTGPAYTAGLEREISPLFNAPFDPTTQARTIDLIKRPAGFSDVYAYPMVNEESTIWFHDHTLGKTHHNVIAGPAGFFPVKDPTKHGTMNNGVCLGGNNTACEYTWVDPITEPRGALGIPNYDLFLAIQDRGFSNDGSINFPTNMAYAPVAPLPGQSTFAPGDNVQVHPVWQPEYFGDHALVNGVLWPKKTVAKGWYRVRLVDGSDSRCYTIGFGTIEPAYATATVAAPAPVRNVRFHVIANEQGYLPSPVLNQTSFTMCPGERYELLIDFGQKTLNVPVGNVSFPAGLPAGFLGSGPNYNSVFMNNTAAAPFPAGQTPQQVVAGVGSPFSELASIMRFDVAPTGTAGVPPPVLTCTGTTGTTWPLPAGAAVGCIKIPAVTDIDFVNAKNLPFCTRNAAGVPNLTDNGGLCIAAERQLYLNERLDGTTLFPLGMQINGVPFEYNVTETPKKGTWETWKIINLTADTHPMHPHLVKAQIVSRQSFNKGAYLTRLCGSATCTPGTAPGGLMQLTPDVTPNLSTVAAAPPAAIEAGWKDAIQTPPNKVTTIVAKWDGGWNSTGTVTAPGAGNPNFVAPTAGNPYGVNAANWVFPDVTSGPYVWHCHINSHEDSEMMRSSLVVK
jgi:spore coat protein A